MKQTKTNSINYLLYEARLSFKYSRKDAAILLGISRLHLYLIEKGYINVSKKLQPTFIVLYKLNDDFFSAHTTYVTPIDKDEEDIIQKTKFRKTFAKTKFKVIAYISLFISLGAVAFGVYGINRRFITPRAAWTETFAEFYDQMKREGTPEKSLLDLDTVYKKTYNPKPIIEEGVKTERATVITSYDKDSNATLTNIDFGLSTSKNDKKTEDYAFIFLAFNRKKVVFLYYKDYINDYVVPSAVFAIEDDLSINLRPFYYYENGVEKRAKKGSVEYDVFYTKSSIVLNSEVYPAVRDAFSHFNLPYATTTGFLNDLQIIARDASLFNRLGLSFIVSFSLIACLSIVLGAVSYHSQYKLKPKKAKEELPSPIISRDIPIRRIYNDTKFPTLIPECALKAVGLMFLAVSSVALFLSVYSLFNADFITFADANRIRSLTSNFLVSAVLLLFFVKLDVYARKSSQALLINIIGLFIGGFMFYIIEILTYRAIAIEGNLFSLLLQALTQIIPGNVIWNVMLYSLIFFFLFTNPKRYDNKPAKLLKWRLFSLIPTFILLFALFYKLYLEKLINSAFYISFLFHTSGVISTLFAIFYIYSLYFLHLRNRLLYGEKVADVYSYSRSFALEKNIIACIIILLLFGVDMFFRFKVPNNDLKLGNNWSIATLIPFILLYRPHIGKRNAQWDNAYTVLYGVTFAGGYIAIALYVLLNLNLGDAFFIFF